MRVLVSALLVIAAISLFSCEILRRSGEMLTGVEVADRQSRTNGYYGTALNRNTYQYKLALMRSRRPQVIAVGSSRVMQFSARSFSVGFANMGGVVNSAGELPLFIESMKAGPLPGTVILGVDYWWFNSGVYFPPFYPEQLIEGDELDQGKISSLLRMVADRKIPLTYGLSIAPSPTDLIGLQAQFNRDGFGPDGFYHYTSLVTGRKDLDRKFARVLGMIRRNESIFARFDAFDENALATFVTAIRGMRSSGIKVITFLPPLSTAAVEEITRRDGDMGFRTRLNDVLSKNSDSHFDMTEPRRIGSWDCEFIDGFHGGAVTYARIIAHMRERRSLGTELLAASLDEDIDGNAGFAAIPDKYLAQGEEVDFLDLGCPKSRNGDRRPVASGGASS